MLGPRGLLYAQVVQEEMSQTKTLIESLQQENSTLKKEIHAIQSKQNIDQRYEEYARINLGMIKQDEWFIQMYRHDDDH